MEMREQLLIFWQQMIARTLDLGTFPIDERLVAATRRTATPTEARQHG